jgi:hypothetical protein
VPGGGVTVAWSGSDSSSNARVYRLGAGGAFDLSVVPTWQQQEGNALHQYMALVLGLLDAIRDILAQVPTGESSFDFHPVRHWLWKWICAFSNLDFASMTV